MLKTLRRLFSLSRTSPSAGWVTVEAMEKRALLSAAAASVAPVSAAAEPGVPGPMLVKEQLIGADPRNVEGIVLTFSEPLDEASAEDLKNYRVGRRTDRRQRFGDDFNNNIDRRRGRHGLVRFETAVYDPAALTVTLTAREPFGILRRFRNIRVLGREAQGVRSAAGNPLDGNRDGTAGGDAIERFTFSRAQRVRYGELDGDNVSLSLQGPGRLWVLRKTDDGQVLARGDAVRVYLDRAEPGSSVLTGRVRGSGNGVAVIDQLVNAGTAQIQIATDPMFQIVQSIA